MVDGTFKLELVREYFPGISGVTLIRLGKLLGLLLEWNTRVNLVSRKDVEHAEEHHLLHALTLARVLRPRAGARFADLGTGGGFPGLPLAVLYPECHFTLVDSIAKKGRVVHAMAVALELSNVHVVTARAETLTSQFDYITGRAVTALPTFLGWAKPLLKPGINAGEPASGVLYFKGTLWEEETQLAGITPSAVWPLHDWVPRPFFEGKFLLHFSAPLQITPQSASSR